jgi:cytochrome P450
MITSAQELAAHPHSRLNAFRPPLVSPPKARGFPLTIVRLLRNPLLCIPPDAYHQPIVLVPGPPRRAYVCDPDLVKLVLLDKRELFPKTPVLRRVLGPLLGKGILLTEGEEWRWQRHTVAPLFRHAEILDYVPTMMTAAERQLERWQAAPRDSVQMIDRDMAQVTYDVISQTMLSGGDDTVGEAIRGDAAAYVAGLPWSIAYGVLGIPSWVPRPYKERMHKRESALRAVVHRLVARRRSEERSGEDLLGRLLAARRPDSGAIMSDEEVVDTLLTFLMAGHDTTAKTLTWALYLLSRSPDWEERTVREIADVVGKGPLTAAHIEALAALTMVIKETLRLFPPAPEITRVASADVDLGGTSIKAGTIVDIPTYVIHRHRSLWHDPDLFDPGRFGPEEEAGRPRYQFIPFGAGPRICIGASFALVEATVLLALFLRKFRFRCPPGFEPVPVSRITLGSRNGMPMLVTER